MKIYFWLASHSPYYYTDAHSHSLSIPRIIPNKPTNKKKLFSGPQPFFILKSKRKLAVEKNVFVKWVVKGEEGEERKDVKIINACHATCYYYYVPSQYKIKVVTYPLWNVGCLRSPWKHITLLLPLLWLRQTVVMEIGSQKVFHLRVLNDFPLISFHPFLGWQEKGKKRMEMLISWFYYAHISSFIALFMFTQTTVPF